MARPKFSKEKLMNFVESRNLREKTLIAVLAIAAILFLDYWLLLRPVFAVFAAARPELRSLGTQKKILLENKKNSAEIEKSWSGAKSRLEEMEKRFVGRDEIPALLENLSKVALGSGVKILSLTPSEPTASLGAGTYNRVEIKISAMAGTHEFGRFLSKLESGTTFFKVTDLKISDNPLDPNRHLMGLSAEVYRK